MENHENTPLHAVSPETHSSHPRGLASAQQVRLLRARDAFDPREHRGVGDLRDAQAMGWMTRGFGTFGGHLEAF